MLIRSVLILLVSFLSVSCAVNEKAVEQVTQREKDVLFILPDGSMMFKGRLVNKEDVVIYDAANRGERAGIKLIIPLHPDAYRDNITVERKEIDVPVKRK